MHFLAAPAIIKDNSNGWDALMKKIDALITGIALILPMSAHAVDSFYCPENHGYIHLGMTDEQVMSACGQPSDIQQSKQSATIKVPVTQLIYTVLNQGAVYEGLDSTYQMWSLPSGSKGVTLQVNIMGDKVTGISMNGSSSNAMSVCGDTPIQIGDSVDAVYSACGSPSTSNQTYINQDIPGKAKPVVWTYSMGPYQASFHLTFLNGILQSIN